MDKKTYMEIYNKIESKVYQLSIDNENTRDRTFFGVMPVLLNHIIDVFDRGIKDIPISRIAISDQRKYTNILFNLTGFSDLDNLAHWDAYINDVISSHLTAASDLSDALHFEVATVDTWDAKQEKLANGKNALVMEAFDIFTIKKRELLLFKIKNQKLQLVTMLGKDAIQLVHDLLEGKAQNE